MLTLSRKLHERIWIGENIIIEIVEIERGKVRIGISAPKEVPVHREEVRIQIIQELREKNNENKT